MHTQSTPTPATTSQLSFWDLDDLARGFISTALQDARGDSDSASEFFTPEAEAERAEGRVAGTVPACADVSDIPADELARVVAFLAPLRERMASEIAEASALPGYDASDVGSDLYLTIVGSGVGFWSRDALALQGNDLEAYEEETEAMANAGHGTRAHAAALARRDKLVSLGDRMSKLCGRGEISLYPDGNADSYVIRFDCLYTSGPAA